MREIGYAEPIPGSGIHSQDFVADFECADPPRQDDLAMADNSGDDALLWELQVLDGDTNCGRARRQLLLNDRVLPSAQLDQCHHVAQ